jgi:CHRD domain
MKRMTGFQRKSHPAVSLLFICLTLSLFLSCGKKNGSTSGGIGNTTGNLVNYTGNFVSSGGNDSTKATGTVVASFNTASLELSYTITWKSLTSQPVQMHFHDAGPVIVKILGYPVSIDGQVTGSCSLTSAQGGDLASGNIYAMIHTLNYSAGEIMATLYKQ